MEALRRARAPFRRQFEKLESDLKGLLGAEEKNFDLITAVYRQIQDLYSEVVKGDERILREIEKGELSEEEEDEEMSGITAFRTRMELIRVQVDKLTPSPTFPAPESVNASDKSSGRHFKLPKIELQKFTGDMKDWLRFWAQFQGIHENPEITGSDKFYYLLQSLEPRTEAYKMMAAYPQSSENYEVAIKALQKRFGDEDLLLQIYIRDLLTLVISNVNNKDKISLQSLFLKIDTHLKALKTLKLENADPATWLFPLVESCLPEGVLYNWQRNPLSTHDGTHDDPPRTRLDLLMEFVGKEVDIQTRMEITRNFGNNQRVVQIEPGSSTREKVAGERRDRREFVRERRQPQMTMGFHVRDITLCVFCSKSNHQTKDCRKARLMSHDEKMKILRNRGLCFNCFNPHRANICRLKRQIKCSICGQGHYDVICKDLRVPKNPNDEPVRKKVKIDGDSTKVTIGCMNFVVDGVVYLQTLLVKLVHEYKEIVVRALLDGGSQRSYILKDLVVDLGLIPKAEEKVIHMVFGASASKPTKHVKYDLRVKGLLNDFQTVIEVRDQRKICGNVPRFEGLEGTFLQELQGYDIELTDIGGNSKEIGLLIGNDMYARLLTGRKKDFDNGLTALETSLGWTLSGEITTDTEEEKQAALQRAMAVGRIPKGSDMPEEEEIEPALQGAMADGDAVTEKSAVMTSTVITENDNVATMSISLLVQATSLTKLWDLETLGIRDPAEVETAGDIQRKIMDHFKVGVSRVDGGRYRTRLPWKASHPPLPTNRAVALRRLSSVTRKLEREGLFKEYDKLFDSWKKEGFIEEVEPGKMGERVHYLPHRAVIKPGSLTTPVRPVFDASSKERGSPSLNDCLEKGENYIQLIPGIILLFREKRIGFVADIRKAFQMIDVHPEDRNSLRFLWWKTKDKLVIVEYRHARVPFGANCSPFILGAILKIHLGSFTGRKGIVAKKLLETFYVDNCCNSTDTIEDYHQFRQIATDILAKAKMDLRMWMSSAEDFDKERIISVLGMKWDRQKDELFVDTTGFQYPEKVTRRVVLSMLSKVFDPTGVTAPGILPLKLIVQQSWANKIKWDDTLSKEEQGQVRKWFRQLPELGRIRIPRCFTGGETNRDCWELHVFNDGSSKAYSSVVFLRNLVKNEVNVQLLGAKSRLAPLKKTTIPRIELLGCVLGVRLANSVRAALNLDSVKCRYWSDSSTALAWIQRNDQWGTFVGRRVDEILKSTKKEDWYYVPGKCNPADLPSRGCFPAELLRSKWWEGPNWLKLACQKWPGVEEDVDEAAILEERRKTPVVKVILSTVVLDFGKSFSYATIVRIQGWVRRFLNNADKMKVKVNKRTFLVTEYQLAERDVIKKLQSDSFTEDLQQLTGLEYIWDEHGVLRVKTRLTYGADSLQFKFPAILPGKHPLVQRLIHDMHVGYCHAGVGFLLIILRRKYWILKARRAIRSVVSKCVRCRRYAAKAAVTTTAPLPLDRIKDSEVFEVTGIDLAGPFLLKTRKKIWLVIYTCAVYRAVHIQLIDSLSTRAFINSLGKFIERYRRPIVIYTDNGTNFRGTDNLFKSLDWERITSEEGVVPIVWKFNPATASWWGGWWERLIRTMKDLLRRTVGNQLLTRSELSKVVKEVSNVMNERPLTYVSEDPDDLEPLTPSLFLNPLGQVDFPEGELTDGDQLRYRYKYMKQLSNELKLRFRREYLGLMISRNPKKTTRPLHVGELVLVGNDRDKRNLWPLGRIMELLPGGDGVERLARVKFRDGVYDRPVQRLYRLEADNEAEVKELQEAVKTRSGRVIKKPVRFN